MENQQPVTAPSTPESGPSVSPEVSQPKSNQKLLIVLLTIIVFLIGLVSILGLRFLRQEKRVTLKEEPSVSLPEEQPSPTGTRKANRQFNTMEEVLSFALTGSGMQYVDSAKIQRIKLLYTPTSKQWQFEFKSKTNPHKKDQYSETLYDFPTSDIKIKSTGEFNLETSFIHKDSSYIEGWEKLPNPTEVVLSSFLDLAKQKVSGAGFQPGQIISADYWACPGCGFTGEWKIDVVLAGEEEKDEKQAKQVVFKDGVYTGMKDVTVKISEYSTFSF